MAKIGQFNKLRVVKKLDFGIYLDGDSHGEILMPKQYVPENCNPEDEIDCFIYLDSEDRIIATTLTPFAKVGEFAYLEVVSVSAIGAFLKWGLPKDLFVPFREQKQKMEVGRFYLVYLYLDEDTNRIAASAKLEQFLLDVPPEYSVGQEVDLLIYHKTDLGYKAIINTEHLGVLYKNEVFQELRPGQKIKGYINKIREDKKIDLALRKPGFEKIDSLTDVILKKIAENNGFLEVSDKTEAGKIYELFGVSKKTFKKAIGALYKKKLIDLNDKGIRLGK